MDNLSGQTFGRYQVIEKLSRGGMADVYKAFDPQLRRFVAIKVIPPALEAEGRLSDRLALEARSLAAFSHPNIVQIYDIGQVGEAIFLVMEYVGGGTLADLTGRPMPEAEAAHWLLPVASALQYAHANGVIHRDVKPANILIRNGQPLLSDFGISKVFNRGQTLAKAALGYGTPSYMSPEQLQGFDVDARSDIYSLGVVLFELLTGSPPFQADNPLGIGIKHLTEPPPRLADVAPGASDLSQAIIDRSLAKDRADRYAGMDEMIADLERIAIERGEAYAGRPAAWREGSSRPEDAPAAAATWPAPPVDRSDPPAAEWTIGPRPGNFRRQAEWDDELSEKYGSRGEAGPFAGRRGILLVAVGLAAACLLLVTAAGLMLKLPAAGLGNGAGSGRQTGSPAATADDPGVVVSATVGALPETAEQPPRPSEQATEQPNTPAPNAGDLEPRVEQFMQSYYDAINRRDYETSWQMLSDRFKASGRDRDNFDKYVEWWNTFESVELLSARAVVVNRQRRIVNVTVQVHYDSLQRGVIEEQYTYRVIFNEDLMHWQIDQ